MNSTHFYHHLEILFWKAAVAVIQEWKRLRRSSLELVAVVLGLFIFGSLVVSIFYLRGFEEIRNRLGGVQAVGVKNTANVYPKQRNTLLVFVDELVAEESHLNGLWVAVTQVETLKTFLLPVFPSVKERAIYLDPDLSEAIGFPSDGDLEGKLVSIMEKKGVWWESYVVIDSIAIDGLVQQLGEIPSIRWFVNGDFRGDRLSPKLNDPWNALMTQVDLLSLLCKRSPSIILQMHQDASQGSLSPHLRSNIPSEQLYDAQKRLLDVGGGVSCEFPTFSDYIADRNVP